jgi:RNA polymerase sigma factor (sigma-70 family)
MATLNRVVRRLRGAVHGASHVEPSDADLLKRFVAQADTTAFEVLIRRHGPMVLSVCHRVLRDADEADDAFQATFLVLLRKASSLRAPGALANWLYGVANRTALHARHVQSRRRAKEAAMAARVSAPDGAGPEWRALLDEELARLPEKYRAALVLCELQGKSRSEAARHLRCAEGTVASRVARGRALLANRLRRHCPDLNFPAIAALLSGPSAQVRPALISSTMQAARGYLGAEATAGATANAAALADAVLRSMLLSKLGIALAALLLVVVAGTAMGLWIHQVPAAAGTGAQNREPVQGELRRFVGTWKVQSLTVNGQGEVPKEDLDANERLIYDADGNWQQRISAPQPGGEQVLYSGVVTAIDASARPRVIEHKIVQGPLRSAGTTVRAIYEFVDDDTLRICRAAPDKAPPADFSRKGSVVSVLKRVSDKKPGQQDAADARADEQEVHLKDLLIDWPADAPIQLESRVSKAGFAQQRGRAANLARRLLGVGKDKELRLAQALLTDKDFPFVKPNKQPIWLVEVKDLSISATGQEPKEPVVWPHMYLAIDSEGDQLIEAFTPPIKSWWRQSEQVVGKAHEDFLSSTNQRFQRPDAPPRIALASALKGMNRADDAAQIVVRHLLYGRGDAKSRPALVVFREGLRLRSSGPAPGSENIGRAMIVLDAETGAILHNEAYGNPAQSK